MIMAPPGRGRGKR